MEKATKDTYLQIVRKHYPHLADEQVNILDGGNDHFVFVVGQEVAFRFARSAREAKPAVIKFLEIFSRYSPLPIPRPEMHFDIQNGVPYETSTFIPGTSFYPEIAKSFTHDELITIARQMGHFLSVLHSFHLDLAREIGVDEMDPATFWEYMQENAFPEYERVVFPHVSARARQWIEKLFADYIDTIRMTPFTTMVTHADMWVFHIIVDSQRHTLSGVIDFGLRIADPANDFKAFEHYGQAFVAEVYSTYDLPIDDSFEMRRLFYTGHDVVYLLAQAIQKNDPKQISIAQTRLMKYIESHPHM
jgi:aminoglycoside 2''-phosphotransferase